MDINISLNSSNHTADIKSSSCFLPVRLSATSFDAFGDCIAFLANHADGQFVDICENYESVLFVILYDGDVYDEINEALRNMHYWIPSFEFEVLQGEVDNVKRIIYLDKRAYGKIVQKNKSSKPHDKTINDFKPYEVLYPYIAYVGEEFESIFSSNPIFATKDGFNIKDGKISASVDSNLLQYNSYCNNCELKGYTQFYDRYVPTEILRTEYLIYSKEGFELLRQFFYDTSIHATKEILSDKVVGAITILRNPPFEDKINSMTIFLTTELMKVERATNVDMKTSTFEGHPIKFLKSPKLKVLALAIFHSLLKDFQYQNNEVGMINYNLLGGWDDYLRECESKGILKEFTKFFSLEKSRQHKRYESLLYELRHNEEVFNDFERFMEGRISGIDNDFKGRCAFIFPKFKDLC